MVFGFCWSYVEGWDVGLMRVWLIWWLEWRWESCIEYGCCEIGGWWVFVGWDGRIGVGLVRNEREVFLGVIYMLI